MPTIVALLVAALLGVSLAAQQPKPRFEVASVKVQTGPILFGPDVIPRARPGGVFNAPYVTVETLLWFAYDLPSYRIVGGPDWIRKETFQINATAGRDVPPDQIKLMVQALLEDRFALVTHVEPREMRVQALVRTRPDAPPGPALSRIDECSPAIVNELRKKFPEKYPPPVGNGMMSSCSSPGLSQFADLLTVGLDTPVIDATGLTGAFYWTLRSQFRGIPPVLNARVGSADPNLADLATALGEQMGLELESRRGPIDVLVIDSIQPPSEN
jgi:uncharacterized protein (TIGR03435 family)